MFGYVPDPVDLGGNQYCGMPSPSTPPTTRGSLRRDSFALDIPFHVLCAWMIQGSFVVLTTLGVSLAMECEFAPAAGLLASLLTAPVAFCNGVLMSKHRLVVALTEYALTGAVLMVATRNLIVNFDLF